MTSTMRLPFFLLATLVIVGAIVTIAILPYGYLLPLVLVGLWFAVWSYTRPIVVISTIVLFYIHLLEQSEGISPTEIAFGFYTYGYIIFWFLRALLFRGDRIIRFAADVFLVGFLGLCFLSGVLTALGDKGLVWWFREGVTISSLLLYFPIRDALKNGSNMMIVSGAFLIVALGVAVYNLVYYRAASLAANYLWEMWGGRQPFGAHFFVAAMIGSVSLYLHSRESRKRIFLLAAGLVLATALAFTYSRGFWFGGLLAGIVLFVLVDGRKKARLFWTSLLSGALGFGILTLVLGNVSKYIFRALEVRFSSSGSGLEDLSIANRVAESWAALALFERSPFVGFGYGTKLIFYNILTHLTSTTLYVHNAYLYLLIKVGAFGLLLFLGFHLSVMWEGFQQSKRGVGDPLSLGLVRSAVAVFAGLLLIATNSGIFVDKQALLIISLGAGMIMAHSER